MTVVPDPTLPGQESVWSFPRPAVAEDCPRHIRIQHAGVNIADSRRSIRTLETSHPPSYYLPPEDVAMTRLRPSQRRSLCEWKGEAVYFDLVLGDTVLPDIAWSYLRPTAAFRTLAGYLAFYAAPLDLCEVDGERVIPQPGGFYGGWITSHVAGPFKGGPGSRGW
ncbi:DUF427 domain-containing protein [Roseomonas sp. USHLN139]|uniref:DUF427 domain-containing protein n=1 Tax=Roseomonas sp. USHLN139 TaxID=3081298 RepID=UPI003B01032C